MKILFKIIYIYYNLEKKNPTNEKFEIFFTIKLIYIYFIRLF